MECYLTATQAAAYLGIAERTIRRMLAAGQINHDDEHDPQRLAIPLSALKTFKRRMVGPIPTFVAVRYADIAPYLGETPESQRRASQGISTEEDRLLLLARQEALGGTQGRTLSVMKRDASRMLQTRNGRDHYFVAHGLKGKTVHNVQRKRGGWGDCPADPREAWSYALARHASACQDAQPCDPPIVNCPCRDVLH